MDSMANRDSENCNEPPEFPNKELQHGESNVSPATCLSPRVYNLLCDSGISNTAYDVLTSEYTIDWCKMDQKLDLIDRNCNIDVTDYCDAVKYIAPCIESIRHAYQKLSPQEFSTSVCPHLLWTRNEKVFLRAFELLQENCSPSKAVLAGLLLTACIEKALGDFYLLKCPIVPYLIKDLIASPEMAEIFGDEAFKVLKIIMGPPQSLNLRNILWHGFVSSEMDARYGFFLLAIAASLGAKLSEQKVYQDNVKYRSFIDFGASEILCAVFPDIGNQEIVELQEVFQSSHLILPIMKEHWQYCLKKYLDCSFGECIALLIPQLEHLLRVLFSTVNHCPERVLTAEAECYFTTLGMVSILCTTLGMILSEFLHDGKKNCLRACLGDNIMELLYDVFVLPEGPRIRDKISHGEADFLQIPKFLTVLLLSTAAIICLKVATKPIESSYLSKLAQIGDTYQTVFHPFAILKKKIFDLIESLKEWKSCPVVESEDLNSDDISDADFVVCDTVHVCVSLVGETFEISHLVFRFHSYSEGLDDLTGALEKLNISSIYRPKIELQFSETLRNITYHSFKSSQNIQQALNEFSDAWKCQALRRRKVLTYIRLLKSLFTLYSGLYIVLMMVVGYGFIINKIAERDKKELLLSQKFLKKMVTYTENLENLTDSNKNMWVESSRKTKGFLNAVRDYCKNVNNIKTVSLK